MPGVNRLVKILDQDEPVQNEEQTLDDVEVQMATPAQIPYWGKLPYEYGEMITGKGEEENPLKIPTSSLLKHFNLSKLLESLSKGKGEDLTLPPHF